MPDWLKLTIPGVFGLMTAVLAAFLSARWAVHRAYREKWWERKEKAYADLIEALHDMIRYCDLMADLELEHREKEQPEEKEFRKRHTEAYSKIEKALDIGAFMISEDAVAILNKLQQRPRLEWKENPPWEIYEDDAKYYRQALSEIRDCARKELKVVRHYKNMNSRRGWVRLGLVLSVTWIMFICAIASYEYFAPWSNARWFVTRFMDLGPVGGPVPDKLEWTTSLKVRPLLLATLIPLGFGWALASLIAWAISCVRAGFRSSNEN